MIEPPLSPTELRILGSLAEKAAVTPDAYPLSIAALLAACNQATSRDPVVSYTEDDVMPALVALRRRGWLRAIQPAGSRVTKYRHLLDEALDLDPRQIALLGVLMLRGEQTVAELFSRTTRLAEFADHAAVEDALASLCTRSPEPLAILVPRRPGQKEPRFMHLLGGPPELGVTSDSTIAPGPSTLPPNRLDALEQEVAVMRRELAELRTAFDAFRQQFG
ncbi:MAG: YceH family protein [Gemmatimonadetes bacterium]|nr:YceH family protein [Gemmatimonadota bacterium]